MSNDNRDYPAWLDEELFAGLTEQVERFAAALPPGGQVVAMYGELGAGKTAFTSGFVKGMGIGAFVSSPTFALVNDYSEGDKIGGDIVISLDTVRTNAEQFNQPYERELHRVIIHGILHLCGINDKGPGEREIMEQNENEALSLYFPDQQ